jgi:hypothetical protein
MFDLAPACHRLVPPAALKQILIVIGGMTREG